MWFFTEEERQLQETCRQFAEKEIAPHAEKHDREESFHLDCFKKLGELGLLGITASPDYGGSGLGATAATIVMEELGRACASTTLSYLAHSILCVNNIDQNATAEQKEKYLPRLISGEWIGCMGMSEADFGSDALGMQTRALKKGDHYAINGSKMWITNAHYAHVAYIYARTGEGKKGLSSFIVDRSMDGFSVGKEIKKMGMRASPTGELIFDNCRVPLENRVSQDGDVDHMMRNLDLERITISGISLGIAKACVEQCLRYAGERKQFGKPIGEFQLIQKMIADMSTQEKMMRSFLYHTCYEYDRGLQGPVTAAQVKLALPQMTTKIALDAIQLHGGYGYSREFPVERYMRDAKLNEIGAGTNEIMIAIIAKRLLRKPS
ncbi:MAG: acyl-CoA dehydrogenase family protein [Bacteriovoracales bacterium]|nr:acyl-CoA dehydrogenase family protein [Bacteriovoracales bacterium]